MNIAYVCNLCIPSRTAASVHVMKMCSAFAAEGNNVTLFIPFLRKEEPGVENIYDFYGIPENFNVEKIRFRVPFIKVLRTLGYSFIAAHYIKRKGFDCVYGRDLYICYISARVFNVPVFFERHTPFKPVSKILFRSLSTSKQFRKLIVITDTLKQHFLKHHKIDADKIYVAPDGADAIEDTLVPKELIGKSIGMFHVGYIGHLYKGRGMEIMEDLATKCHYAFFHIVGGRDSDIQYWKERLSHKDNIHFYGYVPHSQTASYGKSMDALIAPYQNEVYTAVATKSSQGTARWMSPLKIFEYMSMGKPIICSDLPVLREELVDGETCIMCPPDDIDKWCEAIKKLHENQEFIDTIASNALSGFKKYTWRQRAKNLVELIEHGL